MTVRSVDEILGDLAEAKRVEAKAKAARLAIEDDLLSLIADKPERGRAKLGNLINCTVEFKLNYKANVDAIRACPAIEGVDLPLKLVPPSYEFDAKAYEALRASNPKAFAHVAQFVTTTPAKPSFELKL